MKLNVLDKDFWFQTNVISLNSFIASITFIHLSLSIHPGDCEQGIYLCMDNFVQALKQIGLVLCFFFGDGRSIQPNLKCCPDIFFARQISWQLIQIDNCAPRLYPWWSHCFSSYKLWKRFFEVADKETWNSMNEEFVQV